MEGREQLVYANFDSRSSLRPANSTLLIGGMHGDEKATIHLLESFRDQYFPKGILAPTVVLPLANPDGYELDSRYNARGVDLNRNCGHAWSSESEEPPGSGPWSEPEIQSLRDFILELQPSKVISLHWALAEIDADGPQSTGLAYRMWEALNSTEKKPYRVRVREDGRGKPHLERTYGICPGSLGQWCGYGLTYGNDASPAMITLELPYDPTVEFRPDKLPDDHLDYLKHLWMTDAPSYMAAVEGPVHKMLLAACQYPLPLVS